MSSNNESTESVIGKDNFERGMRDVGNLANKAGQDSQYWQQIYLGNPTPTYYNTRTTNSSLAQACSQITMLDQVRTWSPFPLDIMTVSISFLNDEVRKLKKNVNDWQWIPFLIHPYTCQNSLLLCVYNMSCLQRNSKTCLLLRPYGQFFFCAAWRRGLVSTSIALSVETKNTYYKQERGTGWRWLVSICMWLLC